MVDTKAAVKASSEGMLYTIAIFLLTLGFEWMQNLDEHPWWQGLIFILIGILIFVADRYYNETQP